MWHVFQAVVPFIYRESFDTEKEAEEYCNTLIGGGIIQWQDDEP